MVCVWQWITSGFLANRVALSRRSGIGLRLPIWRLSRTIFTRLSIDAISPTSTISLIIIKVTDMWQTCSFIILTSIVSMPPKRNPHTICATWRIIKLFFTAFLPTTALLCRLSFGKAQKTTPNLLDTSLRHRYIDG